jgi:quercetin dioxygenase-like cupin family protein
MSAETVLTSGGHMGDKLVVRDRGAGNNIWMLGGLYEVKAAADETNGALTVMEVTVPVGAAPPPHIHDCGEAIYVLDGRGLYHVGDDVFDVGPGSFMYFPAGTIETFEPTETMRVLLIYTPGGMDQFFEQAGERATSYTVPTQSGPPDVERLIELGNRHGLQLLMPQG